MVFFVGLPTLGFSGFPVSLNNGSNLMGNPKTMMRVSAGYISGLSQGTQSKNWVGFFYISEKAYEAFLKSGHPLAVFPVPSRAATSKFTPSPNRRMRISWSDGRNPLAVRYRVYFGDSPNNLILRETTAERFYVAEDLTYLRDYYWQIEAFDVYGRSTMSQIYSFSVSPSVSSLYCAPNPFRAQAEPTTFIFQMPGAGSAKLSLYLLPHIDLVFSVSLNSLQDGVNTYVYNGTDNNGKTLFNGVYLAVMDMKGLEGNVNQKFRFIVAN